MPPDGPESARTAAVMLLARAELRRSWRSLVALGVLIGAVGAAVLVAVTGTRRSSTAYDRLLARTDAPDVAVTVIDRPGIADDVSALPEVASAWNASIVVGRVEHRPDIRYFAVVSGPSRRNLLTPLVIKGRAPRSDRVGEVLVSEPFARAADIDVGDRFELRLLTRREFLVFGKENFGRPDGPTVELEVVGLARLPAQDASGSSSVFATPAFYRQYAEKDGAGEVLFARLDNEPGAAESFARRVAELGNRTSGSGADQFAGVEIVTVDDQRADVDDSVRVVVAGLVLFSVIAGTAGLLAIGQAVRRYHGWRRDERTLLALGLTRRQRLQARVVPGLLAGVTGAFVAVIGAIAASPLTPVGSARRFEPSSGVEVNVAFLAVGAAVVLVVSFAVFATSGAMATRVRRRSVRAAASSIVTRLASLGARPPAAVGARMALEPGGGPVEVPVRSSTIATIVAVAGVVGALAVAASLDRLVDTPRRYGWPADLSVADVDDSILDRLETAPDLAAVADVTTSPVQLEGESVSAYAYDVRKGTLTPPLLSGRLPASPDELAAGGEVLDAAGKAVGDALQIAEPATGEGRSVTVVGVALSPSLDGEPFAGAIVLTPAGLERYATTTGFRSGLAEVAAGKNVDDVVSRLNRTLEVDVARPPPEVAHLSDVGTLPDLLAGFLAFLGLATIVHLLVVGVRRRRGELAVMRALGFTSRQTSLAVSAMASTTATVALIAGVPLGFLIGNVAWKLVAGSVHVATDVAAPVFAIAALVPAGLLAANVAASVPAWAASRIGPAELLRAE